MTNLFNATESILSVTILIAFIGIAASLLLLMYRIISGPSNPDRAVALDVIGINLMGVAALLSILLLTSKLNDVVLLIAVLSFIGTVAIAKYLEKGVIIGRNDD